VTITETVSVTMHDALPNTGFSYEVKAITRATTLIVRRWDVRRPRRPELKDA